MKRRGIFLASLIAIATWHEVSEAQSKEDIVIIVNKTNPTQSLSREELRPMFQTTKSQWPGGVKINPVNLPDDNATRQGFDLVVLGLDPDRVARYWIDRKIRGGERQPRKVAAPSSVLRAVSNDKGGVGYVLEGEVNDSVRVIARIRNGQVSP